MKMSGDQSRKVRLVKCPKCRKLLQEPTNVPLYVCGGCDTVLQAKVRMNDVKDSKIGIPQTDLAQLNKLEQDKRIGSSGENVVSPAETSSFVQNNETSHDNSGSCTRELPEDRNFQIEVPSSSELTHRSNTPSPETNATVQMLEERKFSNRAPSSVELTQYSSDLSSPVTAASGDESINFSGELPSSAELVHHSSDPLSPAMDASCKVDGVDDRTSISRNGNIDQILITSANSLIDSVDTPSDPMSDRASYEYGGPSNEQENPGQERLRLLRMVYDLQDELHRIQVSQGKYNSRAPYTDLWSANYVPSYVNQETAGKEMDHGSNFSSHLNERDGRWRNWAPYSTSSQISFLGEASHSGLQVDPSCLRCNAQQVQCSMQLPYPVCCCKEASHRVHLQPGECFYNPPSCFLPGHRQYIESGIPQNFVDVKSGDQRRAELYVEYEKHLPSHSVEHPVVKRHLLPIAGAAPFIACYSCQNVLQLPADFLLFRKQFHKLRCGACSKILKFSLKNNTQILPYFWNMHDLRSGEFDSGSDAFYRGNYASGNELTSSSSHPDPISCSEDSGPLPRRSLSTETEQLCHLEVDEHNRKISRSSLQSAEGRKKLFSNQSLSATKSLFKSSSHMLNGGQLSSEIEEKTATSGSPLHRLMGYSSISQVMGGSSDHRKELKGNAD